MPRPTISTLRRLSLTSLLLVWAVVLGLPGSSLAESEMRKRHDRELERWIFSSALEVDIYGQTGKASVRGTPIGSPRLGFAPGVPGGIDAGLGDETSPNVVRSESSREQVTAALVGGDFEIMTPAIADIPTQPRFFLDAFVAAVITNQVAMARDGVPSSPLAMPSVFNPGDPVGERLIVGVGTAVYAQLQGPQLYAGIGAAFTFDLFDEHRIRIKPSFNYLRMTLDVSARANRAVRDQVFTPGDRGLDQEFRTIELSDKFREVYHGIGPALEIEYDTGNRFGPFGISLYMKGGATRLFGDLTTELSDVNTDPQVTGEERVFWKYNQDRWVFRAGTGIRFRFLPKQKR